MVGTLRSGRLRYDGGVNQAGLSGHAQQAAAIAAQCSGGAYFSKFIYVVDEDVDPSDLKQVMWAAATRMRVSEDIDILITPGQLTWTPARCDGGASFRSQALMYACKDYIVYQRFSPRSAISEEQYRKPVSGGIELGTARQAPKINVFDEQIGS
jgi:4-hydroxy-3-polyprenylbenzoate decarboxylase